MRRLALFAGGLAGLAGLALILSGSAPRPLYVDPAGSDTEGNGTSLRPFASVARAAAFIRSSGWNSSMSADQFIYLNAGTYYRSQLSLTDADAGSNGFTIHYAASGGPGSAILDGGVLIPDSAWQLVTGSEYRVLLSEWLPVGYAPWTIYEQGIRAIAARTPKLTASVFYPTAHSGYLLTTGSSMTTAALQYNPGDVTPGSWDLTRTRLRLWEQHPVATTLQTDWFESVLTPTAVNTSTQTFTILNPDGGGSKLSTGYSGAQSRWFAEGDLSMLSATGEFAVSGPYLYYISRSGGAPSGVTIPITKTIVSGVGTDQTHRLSHVSFEGLTVQDSDFDSWTRFGQSGAISTYSIYQQQIPVTHAGAFFLNNVDNVTVTNAHLKNIGESGVFLEGYAQNVTVSHGLIERVGDTGILADGPVPGTGDVMNHNTFTDLYITRFGELTGSGMGIALNQTSFNTVGPGEVWLGPNDAILVSGWLDLACVDMYAHDNIVSGWRVHDVDQDSGDRGGVTVQFESRCGVATPALQNTVQNTTVNGDVADPSMMDFPGGAPEPLGFFNDNQSDATILTNLLSSNVRQDFFANDAGPGPVITNTSFQAFSTAPNPSFDESLMPYASIGASSSNPFAALATFSYFNGFEGSFGDWIVARGSPVISTEQAHDGTHSVKQTSAGDTFVFYPGQRVYGHFEIWMYDSLDTVDAFCSADELQLQTPRSPPSTYFPATDATGNYAALGITPAISTTNYNALANRSFTAAQTRTVGWHRFSWDASTGASMTISIDGTAITTVPGMRAISEVRCGDGRNGGNVGNVYWDSARFF